MQHMRPCERDNPWAEQMGKPRFWRIVLIYGKYAPLESFFKYLEYFRCRFIAVLSTGSASRYPKMW
jgi:hypothetical protein